MLHALVPYSDFAVAAMRKWQFQAATLNVEAVYRPPQIGPRTSLRSRSIGVPASWK